MKKYILGFILMGIVLGLTGCTKTAYPNHLGGKYYMAGDDKCQTYNFVSDTQIVCYNGDNEQTVYRTAMTNQELSMYQHSLQMQQQAMQGYLNRSSQRQQNNAYQRNYNYQQSLNRNNVYKFQQVGLYGY